MVAVRLAYRCHVMMAGALFLGMVALVMAGGRGQRGVLWCEVFVNLAALVLATWALVDVNRAVEGSHGAARVGFSFLARGLVAVQVGTTAGMIASAAGLLLA